MDLLEATATHAGLPSGDAWPDGVYVKAGRKRSISPSGLMKGMTQLEFPVADGIYDNDEEYAGELRDDTPPLSPIQRTWRGDGDNDYKIPPESLNFTHLSTGDEDGWPWAGMISPENAPEAGTPEKSGKYRRKQAKPTAVVKLDKGTHYHRNMKQQGNQLKTYSQRNKETTSRLKNQPKDWWNRGGKGPMQDGIIMLRDLI